MDLGGLILAALVVWFVGALLMRLAATSCLLVAAGLLATGAPDLSAARAAAYAAGCWVVSELLHRARRGHWRSARAARLASRARALGHY